jgi:hypothetical protein
MTTRTASCSCGQLSATCAGEPVRISMCHCLACQKRTGSVFGVQARFPREHVQVIGEATRFTRTADSGNTVTYSFCPVCGSRLLWELSGFPDVVAVAVGGFADPDFPPPRHSVFEAKRHTWVAAPSDPGVEHLD